MNNNNMKEDDVQFNDEDEDEDKKFSPGIKTCIRYIYVVTKFPGLEEYVNSFCKWKNLD